MAEFSITVNSLILNNFNFGLQDYPLFDTRYRPLLNQKILEHYRFHEMGFEVEELFRHYLNTTMNEIMPYYNQLYKSELIEFDPMNNIDTEKLRQRGNSGESTSASTSDQNSTYDGETNSDSLGVGSDTPQGMLSIGDIKSNTYASNASMDNAKQIDINHASATADSNTNADFKTWEDFAETYKGLFSLGKSSSQHLLDYRKTFINIDMMIIRDLGSCFMGIYQ